MISWALGYGGLYEPCYCMVGRALRWDRDNLSEITTLHLSLRLNVLPEVWSPDCLDPSQ